MQQLSPQLLQFFWCHGFISWILSWLYYSSFHFMTLIAHNHIEPLRDQGHFFAKSNSKLLFLLRSSKKTKKLFLQNDHNFLYFTCLRSCDKNFIKFNSIDWKILAFKVGKKGFLNTGLQFQMTFVEIR